MTWFNQRLYLPEEAKGVSTVDQLPCKYQVGEEVALNLFDEKGTCYQVPCIVGGVSISDMHEIRYSLLFELACGLYVRQDGFRGYISKRGELIDENGGLLTPGDLKTLLGSNFDKPKLSLVVDNDV